MKKKTSQLNIKQNTTEKNLLYSQGPGISQEQLGILGDVSIWTNFNSTKQIQATLQSKTTEETGHTSFGTCTK